MKALTLWQPWASLVACGMKRYETRSWNPLTRGLHVGDLLAIHAAACKPKDVSFEACYAADDGTGLPLGAVLCVCRLVRVIRTEGPEAAAVSDAEKQFGEWSPGRFAWKLEIVRVLDQPEKATGRQGLWNYEPVAPAESES